MYSPKTAVSNFAHELCSKKKAHLDAYMMMIVQVGGKGLKWGRQLRPGGEPGSTLLIPLIPIYYRRCARTVPLMYRWCITDVLLLMTLLQVLNGYQAKVAAGGAAAAADARRMDGALLAVGIMADLLKNKVWGKVWREGGGGRGPAGCGHHGGPVEEQGMGGSVDGEGGWEPLGFPGALLALGLHHLLTYFAGRRRHVAFPPIPSSPPCSLPQPPFKQPLGQDAFPLPPPLPCPVPR